MDLRVAYQRAQLRLQRGEDARHFLRLARQVLAKLFALELGSQVMAQVMTDEIRTVSVVAVESVDLAEGVVQGGVEGAGHDQGAEGRDRLDQAALPGQVLGGAVVVGLQRPGEVDGVAGQGAGGGCQ